MGVKKKAPESDVGVPCGCTTIKVPGAEIGCSPVAEAQWEGPIRRRKPQGHRLRRFVIRVVNLVGRPETQAPI